MKAENARIFKVMWIATVAAALAACASGGSDASRDASLPSYNLGRDAVAATTVNRYLWAASLETLDFLPIQSADPIAGLIITEWYSNPEAPNERFKTNVYILDSALRADALRVSVFRQVRGAPGLEAGSTDVGAPPTTAGWMDQPVNPATAREIENAILTRARELRLNTIG